MGWKRKSQLGVMSISGVMSQLGVMSISGVMSELGVMSISRVMSQLGYVTISVRYYHMCWRRHRGDLCHYYGVLFTFERKEQKLAE